MSDILRQLQADIGSMAEFGRTTTEIGFDELNRVVGEIERLTDLLRRANAVIIKAAASGMKEASEYIEYAAVGRFPSDPRPGLEGVDPKLVRS